MQRYTYYLCDCSKMQIKCIFFQPTINIYTTKARIETLSAIYCIIDIFSRKQYLDITVLK